MDLNSFRDQATAEPKKPELTIAEKIAAVKETIKNNTSLLENLKINPPILTEEQIADGENEATMKQKYELRIMVAKGELEKLENLRTVQSDRFDIN